MSEWIESVAAVEAVLFAAALAGFFGARALLPRGRAFFAERLSWGLALGLALLAAAAALSASSGARPGRWVPVLLGIGAIAAGALLPRPVERGAAVESAPARPLVTGILILLCGAGVLLYCLRALTEPMWSNDYVAIWGFKGKTIWAEGAIPERLFSWPSLAYAHPEYPLGLPLLYAGIAGARGAFDDHAMAVLFPYLQIATLLALYGWLRRRGASGATALAAAAAIACFSSLYSGFLVGMAEVPLSFALLLFGAALADALDRTDDGAVRRVTLAAALLACLKNEGLFAILLALVGLGVARLRGRRIPASVATAAALPGLIVFLAHRLAFGRPPMRDFDFGRLAPSRWGALPALAAEAFAAAARIAVRSWPLLAAVALLILIGRRVETGDRLLALAAGLLAAYLLVPILSVAGPRWLVDTTLARVTAALAPLLAAGIGVRIRR
ncbi:MAG TPA: hypothetical protein VIA29_00035 [Thermoanaerobaculia bacterium]